MGIVGWGAEGGEKKRTGGQCLLERDISLRFLIVQTQNKRAIE